MACTFYGINFLPRPGFGPRSVSAPMELTLIFPHQLFDPHPAVARGRKILLLEDPLFFGTDARWPLHFHRQKLVLHRASLAAYTTRLQNEGYQAEHVRQAGGGTEDLLDRHVERGTTVLHVVDPVDDVLGRRLARFAARRQLTVRTVPTPQFLSPPEFLDQQFPAGRKPFMARFYQAQRQRMGILLEPDGSPRGGQWSFDADNRKKLSRTVEVPEPRRPARSPGVRQAIRDIAAEFPGGPGDPENFAYPVTHAEADVWLEDFLQWRFHAFGPYEDALSVRHRVVFHSVLTPCLNIGLLNPDAVIRRALAHAETHDVPLNSLEGFVRQIVGWREFMRAMYERHGRTMRRQNFWGFERPMPRAFYDGTTGIEPVDHVIRSVRETAYGHHIERLMILGNMMLLCRIHPDAVYRWFMEMFIDAYDWVMVPNVYGMSQYADGGFFTTKPYFSGSNYVRKMSDFPSGSWCEVWDGLFWTFLADHRDVFLENPRLAMMARTCDKLGQTLVRHRRVAERFLSKLE